jgi:3-oxoacyl-(acyl-carrier-protein) synthase
VSPIAEIIGFGESFEAHSLMAVEPSGNRMAAAVDAALDDADLRASDVDYVNAHGTGTEVNDRVEAEVIERCYGRRPAVNATKSLTGHTVGAAGAIEAAVTALALRDQHLHGCHNLEDPILPLNFVRSAQRVPIATAASHSFAFGGHNAVLALRRFVQ